MQTIEYFKVVESPADVGFDKILGRFKRVRDAHAIAAGSNWRTVYQETIVIYDTITEYQNDLTENIRTKALAKLTKEERQALGFV